MNGWVRAGAILVAGIIGGSMAGPMPVTAAGDGVLRVRFGGDRVETRMVLDVDQAVTGKLLDGQASGRTVIALADLPISAGQAGAGQGLVNRWSVDRAAGGARLALDLAPGAQVSRRFLLPPADGVAHYRYVVDIKAADGGEAPPVVTVEAPRTMVGQMAAAFKPTPATAAPIKAAPLRYKKVVVVDAGHGGKDPGALGASAQEKAVTLAAAKALKTRLEKTGRFEVVLTRTSDLFVPLEQRVQIARRADADLFISLHADSGSDATLRGASVYTLADRAAGRVNQVLDPDDWLMKASAPGRDRAISQILLDLSQRATKNRSATFAEMLIEQVGEERPLLRRSHREAGLMVLLAPDVPAVLLEMGFITNADDERALTNEGNRKRVVDAVARSIESYFARETRIASR
jgi:N-acetylmuramoyl-L-alanine amidase